MLAEPGESYCEAHKRPPWRDRESRRPHVLSGKAKTERNRRIMRRYHRICHVCKKPGADEVDHVICLAEGGLDDDSNLRPIHARPCHRRKTEAEARRAKSKGIRL